MSWGRIVPCFLDRDALNNDYNACKEGDEDGSSEEGPDEDDLYRVSHNSQEEYTDGQLAHPNDHDTGGLTEDFIFDSFEVNRGIVDVQEKSSESVSCRVADEGGINDLEDL